MLDRLEQKKEKLAVIGLGYVGMPLAVAFAEKFDVIGYDNNEEKIQLYKNGIDPTEEIGAEGLKKVKIDFTSDATKLKEAAFVVIAVPTPINGDKTPDLGPVKAASRIAGQNLKQDAVVVYESTVYPGVTEDICVPIIERESNLVCGKDFKIGYSPERINPGDKVHRLQNIVKIVSGMDEDALNDIADVYDTIIDTVYKAPSIKVAEAAKLVENAQRDINIAFMNELSIVFHRMHIDTNEVLKAMNTKWNALGFKPGLVGGHCIGVDPYYFIYEAEKLGYHSQIISSGRRINNGMSEFVVNETIKMLLKAKVDIVNANIYLMGMTFKENCPDTRNSRAIDVYHIMRDSGVPVKAVDPVIESSGAVEAFKREYGIELTSIDNVKNADCLVYLVAHDEFQSMDVEKISELYADKDKKRIIIDVKSMFDRAELEQKGFLYWNL